MLTSGRLIPKLALLLLCSFSSFTLPACSSIYHRAGEEMPSDMRSRLATRVRDARSSAAAAADLIAACPPESADLPGRAESYSWEFTKAVASIHDVANRLDTRGEAITDLLDAFDRADRDLAAAADPEQTQASALRPAFSLAAESLKLAIQQADSYLGNRPLALQR